MLMTYYFETSTHLLHNFNENYLEIGEIKRNQTEKCLIYVDPVKMHENNNKKINFLFSNTKLKSVEHSN